MSDRRNVGVEVPGIGDRWNPLDHVVTEPAPTEPALSEGPHAGKGPKGRRSDDRVHDAVCQALEQSAVVDASGIEVIVTDDEIFLTGIVADPMQKTLAVKVVETVSANRPVHDRLEIPTEGPPIDPAASDIATESTISGATRDTRHFTGTS